MPRWLAPFGLAFALLVCACGAEANEASPADQSFPALTGRVVDNADLLPPDREAALVASLERLERELGAQLVLVTVPTLGDRRIEEFGVDLGRHWRVGRAGINDGVLLIVAPNDRKVRIEVGYGLEYALTDPFCAEVMRREILPRFRAGDMAGGIEAGTQALIARMRAMPLRASRDLAA